LPEGKTARAWKSTAKKKLQREKAEKQELQEIKKEKLGNLL